MLAPAVPDHEARKAIESSTHAGINLCWTCSSCDVECPINIATNRLRPQKIVHLANLGFIDELLSLPEIWYCLTCRRCDYVCPTLVKPFTVISYLRKEAVRLNLLSMEMDLRYRDLCARLQHVRWHVAAQCLKGDMESITDDKWYDWMKIPIKGLTSEIFFDDIYSSIAFRKVADNSNVTSCFTCGGCSGACPVFSGRSVFDPLWIFRMVYLGLEKEILKSPSIWLCIACQRCTEVCDQRVKGHLIIQRLQELALEKGVVDSSFPFRWYEAQKAIYPRFIKEIDALFMDPGLDGLDKYKDHLELHFSREAIIAEFKIADCV